MSGDFPLPLAGGCFCGAVRYRIAAEPLFSMACHCTDCQQMTASAFSLGLAVPQAGFVLEAGEPRPLPKTGDSGHVSTRFVCPDCGVWTHTELAASPEVTVVRPSSLDDPAWVRPVAEIYTRSAHDWARLAVPLSYEAEFDDPAPLIAEFRGSGIRPAERD